jgi:hypothetical protein
MGVVYHVESEQVSLAKRITRTSFVFVITLLGALLVHRLWFPQTVFEVGERVFDAIVAAGTFFLFDSQR